MLIMRDGDEYEDTFQQEISCCWPDHRPARYIKVTLGKNRVRHL